MARKKNTETEESGEAAKSSEVMAVISAGRLKKLMGAHRAAVRDSAQIAQALGAEIREASKNNHLHTGAFKLACKLDKMEPEELRSFMDNFEYYYDVSGLKKRADSVVRMDLEQGGDDEAEAGGNVHGFPGAAGRA
jgi:hypothetical protein